MKIYERTYDNPLNEDGTRKPNKYLGNFKIIQIIFEDIYSSQRVGVMKEKIYLIEEREVSGFNGGTRFSIKELIGLTAESQPSTGSDLKEERI